MEKPREHFVLLSSFFFLLFAALVAAQNVSVRVGVILDLTSTPGKRSKTSISMAIDDFYALHADFTTRVALDFRDSRNNAIEAASAAVDLIKNAQVQAIIGPLTSDEAKFVAYLGNRTHVPILSFSATSPTLSPMQTPFFVRAAANDSFQTLPITAIVNAYNWRAAVPVSDESEYGEGILPPLVDALQSNGVRIPDRASVPSNATVEQIDTELERIKGMSTRVFIVHMHPDLAVRFFHRAQAAGMMTDGYVWIVTDCIGGVVDAIAAEDVNAMKGVISLRPYVNATSKVASFSARFKARFQQENPGATDVADPTVLQLWAYDAAWAMALAAEVKRATGGGFLTSQSGTYSTDLTRLGVSAAGPRLLSAVLKTSFDGLAGKFNLVDGQLQLSAYEIVNIIGKGVRTVGFWTPSDMIVSNLTSSSNSANANAKITNSTLKPVIWPGDSNAKPKGWNITANGKSLRIGVPVKKGFFQFVNASDPNNITGYCIDIFNAVMKNLPYDVPHVYKPYPDSSYSYENLVMQVYYKKFDAVVGDTTILANRTNYVDFTMPYADSGVSMVVPVKQDSDGQCMWIFLRPLTTNLWLASFGFFLFTGLVVWVIEHRINPEFRGTPWQQFGLIIYFAFSTLVFAHKEKLESNLSRLAVIIWVFVVLILQSSYTASLTSMLTVQQLQPTVTDVKELLRNGDYVGIQNGSFVANMLTRMNFDESKIKSYSTPAQYAEALKKGSANGGVAAIFDEIPYLKVFLSEYSEYTMVGPTYKTVGFGFVFPRGSPLVQDVSTAILTLAEGNNISVIEQKWFKDQGASFQSQSSSGNSSSLGFQSFGGLFIITGVVSGLMLLIYIGIFVYKERYELTAEWSQSRATFLKRVIKIFDDKDPTAPSVRNGVEANQNKRARDHDTRIFATAGSPVSMANSWDADFQLQEEIERNGVEADQNERARDDDFAIAVSPVSIATSSNADFQLQEVEMTPETGSP